MRIPDYYCPHCGKFKRRRDVTVVTKTWLFKEQEFMECKQSYVCERKGE